MHNVPQTTTHNQVSSQLSKHLINTPNTPKSQHPTKTHHPTSSQTAKRTVSNQPKPKFPANQPTRNKHTPPRTAEPTNSHKLVNKLFRPPGNNLVQHKLQTCTQHTRKTELTPNTIAPKHAHKPTPTITRHTN
eukprot:gene2980-1962_t